MGGIEQTVWVRVGDTGDKVFAITNEDIERTRDEKAAAVHFMRFELSDPDIAALKAGTSLFMGIDHDSLQGSYEVSAEQRTALVEDLA
jgi:hypothetical protein